MQTLIILLAVFVLILVLMAIIRTRISETFEIRNSDILIALIPIAFWLILSEKVKVIEFGGFKIEAAFLEAAEAAIGPQVEEIPIDPIEMGPKGGVGEILRLIEQKTEALVFQLGHGGYYGPAIGEYLRKLTAFPFFKYLVINDEEGRFFGLVNARSLNALFQSRAAEYDVDDFARWLNGADTASLSRLPGFIGADHVIQEDTDKQTALIKLEELNVETLPVVDEDGSIVGVVDRSRLASSLIIEVAGKVR